ncbi:P-loop NTPase fold protein [Alteromonas stellipolaris]|uniref:P-loop NTPase fold protein n=1 Tax=Alteromonas stellipolaris TaxID=233316 RepID=UPI0026E40985|nr:P-loop NTPase fold protein [Alteromonas stellipolaris]MDO6533859.1 P-loop NTPase fold protein [Alteromonas stellipolaris]MDO6626247.1 P-loop NTPase fold protein [Alteromonas stellipolaris]
MKKSDAVAPPELLIILKSLFLGLVVGISVKLGVALGKSLTPLTTDLNKWIFGAICTVVLCYVVVYSLKRGAARTAAMLVNSRRLDLLIFVLLGVVIEHLVGTWSEPYYKEIESLNSMWVLLALVIVITGMSSVVFRKSEVKIEARERLSFALDDEVTEPADDLLDVHEHAKSFAESVIENGCVAGLVYGIDGPWGIGKSSFINLAQKVWDEHEDLIVCRFEPLRYANEQDLSERLIREVTAEIQKSVFAPEFRPVANRYTRLIKGKAGLSLFGIKFSFQPSNETVEDLITDIDAVLKRVGRRLIIVIDDLDRLDHKTINSVLFSTRRTFKLSQATYVLSYDTELLVGNDNSVISSREFLEKFVSIKYSLFVEKSFLRRFLTDGWKNDAQQLSFVPSDTLDQLAGLLAELSKILDSEIAPRYLPLVGNLRKIKRIINAMVSMRIESSSLNSTDFNKRDLLNLILLQLNYPGIFRRVYAEETDKQQGLFSIRVDDYKSGVFNNHPDFYRYMEDISKDDSTGHFLLEELFDVKNLDLGSPDNVDIEVKSSRACFNSLGNRNLEDYLRLIVRFVKPEAKDTYILYKNAFDKIKGGKAIKDVLNLPSFQTEETHDKFWRVLTNNCYDLKKPQADNVITYLIDNLADYASISLDDRPMRIRSVYTLVRILDRVGWRKEDDNQRVNSAENVEEIAWRIFGEGPYAGHGIIDIFTNPARGVLGWFDLILLRLTCCADRSGQLYEVSKALIYNQDKSAKTTGQVDKLTIFEMRKLSQVIAKKFIETYVDTEINFYKEVDKLNFNDLKGKLLNIPNADEFTDRVKIEKSLIASFIIYQLVNSKHPTGSGVGFGYYDLNGVEDNKEISARINDYVFNVCFSPAIDKTNVIYFLDHCLSHLSHSFFSYGGNDGYVPTKTEILGGLDEVCFVKYWTENKLVIKEVAAQNQDREVYTSNYIAFYNEDLEPVFETLDELEEELSTNVT